MTLKEFCERLESLMSEIGAADLVDSHPMATPSLRISIEDPYELRDFVVDRVEIDTRIGCGCPEGVNIVLRVED